MLNIYVDYAIIVSLVEVELSYNIINEILLESNETDFVIFQVSYTYYESAEQHIFSITVSPVSCTITTYDTGLSNKKTKKNNKQTNQQSNEGHESNTLL